MHCVDLGESFPTHIFLQNLASIQPITSLVKFARSPRTDPPGRICSLIFWWYGVAEIGEFATYNVAGVYLMFAQVVQVLQSLDFMFSDRYL